MRRTGNVRYYQGNWKVRITHNGERIHRIVRAPNDESGRLQAEAVCALVLRQYTHGGGDLTLSDLIDLWVANHSHEWSPGNAAVRVADLVKREYGEVRIRDLKLQTIEAVNKRWLAEGRAPGTVRARHAVVRAALNEAVRLGLLDRSPADLVRLPKVPKTDYGLLDLAEVSASIDRIEHAQTRLAARLALATGARLGEIVGLQWKDIDLNGGSIRFVRAAVNSPDQELVYRQTKNGVTKHLSIDQHTTDDLRAWRVSTERRELLKGKFSPWVFISPRGHGGGCRPHLMSKWWRTYGVPAGLGHLKFHGLRHLHATALLSSGVPLHAVSVRLGHATPRTTLNVYSHAQPHHDQLIADFVGASTRRSEEPVPQTELAALVAENASRISGTTIEVGSWTTLVEVDRLAAELGVDPLQLVTSGGAVPPLVD